MNATLNTRPSIRSLSYQLAVALCGLGWDVTRACAKFTVRVVDRLCLITGALTLMLWCYFVAAVLTLHIWFTSYEAMRRYKYWGIKSWRFAKRVYRWIDYHSELCSQWMMDKIYLRGSLGEISFDVPDDERDGYIVVREFGDQRMVEFGFYCENRRLLRLGMTGRAITELRSRAMDQGFGVVRIVVGDKVLTPYARLPEIQLPEVMSWTPAAELPNPRNWAGADILTRVA